MISQYIQRFNLLFPELQNRMPWDVTNNLTDIISEWQRNGMEGYAMNDQMFIHNTSVVEQNVIMKGPVVIGRNCFVGANAYLRGPVFLDENVSIGAGCEIKQSIIFSKTAVAHFNYIGNSVVGSNVNFEAGSVAANHFNEREIKNISVMYGSEIISTGSNKFGSLIGDHSKIGANAVLSPGTLLSPGSVVKRLQLIEQVPRGG